MKLNEEELKKIVENLTEWIQDQMERSGGKKILIGISGGKDSSVVAALGVEALGKENVIGILMPNGEQGDINFAYDLCEIFQIENITMPIDNILKEYIKSLEAMPKDLMPELSNDTFINLPPRIRMSILYAISQSIVDSRVKLYRNQNL